MRISFTNETRTSAVVERGLFSKVRAKVTQVAPQTTWHYTSSGCVVPRWIQARLDEAQEAAHWQPVVDLPRAWTIQ